MKKPGADFDPSDFDDLGDLVKGVGEVLAVAFEGGVGCMIVLLPVVFGLIVAAIMYFCGALK